MRLTTLNPTPRYRPALLAAVLLAATAQAAEVPLTAPASGAEVMLKSLEDRLGGNPFDPIAMNNHAVVRLAENDPYAAAELLGRAFQLAPDNAVIADNNTWLASWIEARARAEQRAARGVQGAVIDDGSQPFPPEPPPLWPRR